MRYCAPDLRSRVASEAAVKLTTEANAERNARKDFCAVIDVVQKKGGLLEPGAQRHLLEQLCNKYKRNRRGALDDQTTTQYFEAHKIVKSLCQKYGYTIMDDEGGLWIPAKDVDSVPKSYASDSSQKGHSMARSFFHFEIKKTTSFYNISKVHQ